MRLASWSTDSHMTAAPQPTSLPQPAEHEERRRDLPDYLPARMLNEYVYCPRLFFYEWVEGVFAHNADTVEGALRHEKMEGKGESMPEPGSEAEGRFKARSITLSSEEHRLIATIDLVEGEGNSVSPVDYKKGGPRDGVDGPEAWPPDRIQIAAQAIILRENGYDCHEGVIYYDATKQRVRVRVDEDLIRDTLQAAASAWELASRGHIPPPLEDSPKCPRCSLVGICLPDETAAAMSLPSEDSGAQLLLLPASLDGERRPLDGDPSEGSIRRLVPARDDLRPLYVIGQGLSVGKTGAVLQIRDKKTVVQEARINEISQVNLFGSIQVTAAAVQGLCWAEKPITHFSFGGWFYGLTQGLGLKNVFLRRDQFRRAEDERFCLRHARDLVASKIRNERTLLRRNHVEPPARVLARLKRLAEDVAKAKDLGQLLGLEGSAARLYFENFKGMLKAPADGQETDGRDEPLPFDFTKRNRRPPRDPVNALLSLAYSLLAKDLTIVCHGIGFDPFVGFYHQPRFGRPALALDLMEGFRPLIADSVVLNALNTRMITPEDFIRAGPAVALTAGGRKALIQAYEQRMNSLVTHPLFGYRVSYRRVLEIQARLLARVVTGELLRYPGFETR